MNIIRTICLTSLCLAACSSGGKPAGSAQAANRPTCEEHCEAISRECGAMMDSEACASFCAGYWQRADADKAGCKEASGDLFACKQGRNIEYCRADELRSCEAQEKAAVAACSK